MSATTEKLYVANQIDRSTRDAYFEQVDGFGKDRLTWANRVASGACLVAIALGTIAVVEGFAIAQLSTRAAPEPIILRQDNTTGLVDRIYNVAGSLEATEAENRHWLWQFTKAAEGYSYAESRPNFDTVTLMASPSVQAWQAERVKGSNPLSPQNVLGRNGEAVLNWESTTFINKNLAQVRYTQTDRKGDNVLAPRHMIATVGFTYVKGGVSGAALNVNPRGFLVTSYTVDQEGAR